MGAVMSRNKKKIPNKVTSCPNNLEKNCSENDGAKIEYALKSLERIDAWLNNCDSKIALLLGIWGVFLTICLTSESIRTIYMFVVEVLLKDIDIYKVVFLIAMLIVFGAYGNTLRLIVSAMLARIDSKCFFQSELSTVSNWFFGSIADRTYSQYKKEFTYGSMESQLNDILSQVYINSQIARKKYKNYNKCLLWSIISAISTTLLVALAIVCF